ncbi:MAG: DUF3426 domain-containing protein [Lysobacter sp.]|nr:DUF3426 domain-containing protein [Lysobacter sp.]
MNTTMFVACPHCGFLVALILPAGGSGARVAPQRCPRCERELQADAASTAAAEAPTEIASERDQAPTASEAEPAARTEEAATAATGDAPVDSGLPNDALADGAPADIDAADAADPVTAAPITTEATAVAAVVPTLEEAVAASALPDTRTRPARGARTARVKRDAPSFVRGTATAPPPRRDWRAIAAIVVLLLALALQLVLAQRQELAADARWRPLVSALCGVLRCSLPPWHEPTAYSMLGRNVRPSPGAPGVLRVNASFRNDARWPQRWPTLLLTLSDVDGRDVGQRAFAPADYRRGHKPTDELAPGQSATVQLDVVEPAPRIVAFTFDFQ